CARLGTYYSNYVGFAYW
nr:immunoglobulin heavy chain junction region [Mus musculus]